MKQEQEIRALKRRLTNLPRRESGQRAYTEEIRTAVLKLGDQWRKEGRSLKELAAKLGVSGSVFAQWQRRKERQEKRQVRLRSVQVKEQKREDEMRPFRISQPVLVMPNGMRVEGLGLEELAVLLSRLS